MINDVLTIDFETYSEADISKTGSYVYSEHPSTEVLMMGYKFNNEPRVILDLYSEKDSAAFDRIIPTYDSIPKRIIEHIKAGKRVIAHNVAFEWAIWKNVCVRNGWPIIQNNQWFDTMAQCGAHALPLSLDKSTEVLELSNIKNDEGKALIKLFSCPQKDGKRIFPYMRPEKYGRYLFYCEDDVDATYELYSVLLQFKSEELNHNIPLTLEMNENGIPVDVESAKLIYPKILKEKESYTERISALTGGVITTVNQTQRMKKWMGEQFDIEMPNFQADTVIKYLAMDIPDKAKQLLEMRSNGGKSSTSKYERLIDMASKDGNIHSVFVYHGTTTGRLTGRAWQPTNLAKPSIEYESMDKLIEDLRNLNNDEINERYGSFMKAASSAMRGHIKAPDGMELFGADYAAIEARVVFWLANCMRGLKTYHDGLDMYKDIATVIYKVQYEDVNDEQRWLGKQCILGAGYGIGWRGFQNACLQYNVSLPDETCQLAVDTYRETYPEIVDLWASLERAAMLAMTTGKECFAAHGRVSFKLLKMKNKQLFLFMKLPSGRLICYPKASIGIVKTPWGAKKKAITFRKLVNNHWAHESTYGGKLVENACQAIARDIMYVGMKNASAAGFKTIMQVYDELISLAPKGFMNIEDYENLLCNPMPEWSKGLPLEAEGKVMPRYQKL